MKHDKTKCKKGLLVAFMLCVCTMVFAQNKSINGVIVDASSKEPLPGALVTVKGVSNSSTESDMNGRYTIKASDQDVLVVSFIGYLKTEIQINGRSVVDVEMEEDVRKLDEIVVIGYGVQKKKDLTGAVSVVDMKEAKKLTAGSFSEILQGQVPGVSVRSSGDPGSMGNIRIRGIGSFSNVGPLYVVDGLIVNDVNHINPEDIESMQVLKDASSTAIYGSRGANGVIIVTTKKGEKGVPKLDFSATFGTQEIAKKIKMKNTTDFLYYNELAYINAGLEWPGQPKENTYLPNSDFQSAIFEMGNVQDYNLTYSQGTDNLSMMMGGGYFSQDGVLAGPFYKRFTYRINTEARFGIIKIGEHITLSNTNQKTTNTNTSSFTNALMMPPVLPIYDPNEPTGRGGFGYGTNAYPTYTTNPVAQQESVDNRVVNNRIIGNVYLEMDLFKLLTYKLNAGLDFWYGRTKNINYAYTMRMGSAENKWDNVLNEIRDQRMTKIMEHTLNFNKKYGKHSIEALAGFTVQDDQWHYLRAEGYNQLVDGLWQIDLVGTQNNMWGSEQEHRLVSYLGRVNYNYNDRYLIQFNIRRDGSSKFGPERRWGVFPSGSIGWRVEQEEFFEPYRHIVDDLKIRASYGKIGDMQALGNYDYIADIDNDGPYEGFYAQVFGGFSFPSQSRIDASTL